MRAAETLVVFAVRRPAWVLISLVALTGAALFGVPQLRSVSYLEGNLPRHDPELESYRQLLFEFGSDQSIVMAISCESGPCDDIFHPEAVRTLEELSEAAIATRGVERVLSLATVSVLDGSETELSVVPALSQPSSAHDDPTLVGHLISRNLRTTALVVSFSTELSDAERNHASLEMVEALRVRAGTNGFELFASGVLLRAAVADSYVRRDLVRLTPGLIGFIAVFLYWTFREAVPVLVSLLAVGVPTVWAFGLMGWTDTPITPITSTMPIVVLVIGVTDAVHFLVRAHEFRAAGRSPAMIVSDVAREVGPPTTVTAVTSALGFLSFLAGPIPSLREFGFFCAIGVLGGWLLTFTLIPIVVTRRGARGTPQLLTSFQLGDALLNSVRRIGYSRAPRVLVASGVVLAIAIGGVQRLVPENDTIKLLGEGDPLVVSEAFFREHLRPPDTLEILYEPHQSSVLHPKELQRLRHVERALETEVGAEFVLSPLTILAVANREIGSRSLTVPYEPGAASQLILLAEAADPEKVRRLLTADHRVARISAGYAWQGSRSVERDLVNLRTKLEEVLGPSGSYRLTGSVVLSTHLGDAVLDNQVASFSAAFATIFAVLFFFVRSLPLAALGMVPNILPVAVILGFMGYAGINLDVGTAMIASILLGVSTDDTVYFLTHYKRARSRGATVQDAVSYTFAVAGKPAIFSATALASGFFLLGFSSFQSLSIFGFLSGVAVLFALACELLIMPALLRSVAGRGEEVAE